MSIHQPFGRVTPRLLRSCRTVARAQCPRMAAQNGCCSYATQSNARSSSRQARNTRNATITTLVAGAGLAAYAVSQLRQHPASCEAPSAAETESEPAHDTRDPQHPRYRLADVRKHDASSDHPWVIFEDKIYDITDWIPAHPGGSVILRAAGGSIDPYWNIFSIHKTQYVYDILAQYFIGYVDAADLKDGRPAQDEIEDPFADDPTRHRDLIVQTAKPQNAETPGDAMSASFLTPNDLFYVRNHMWVPKVQEPEQHVLTIELDDGTTKEYTLADLKSRFKPRKITAALQCSGNRRKDMSEGSGRVANGLQWSVGAISNASWEGVVLADVLADAGLDVTSAMAGTSEAKHVQFSGMEAYGASIPIKKAIDPQGDVLLAYSMNDQPLPRDHGFPLRAIVPGHVAARSVKWLKQITLSEEESPSQWQRRDYKCFGPNETDVDWDAAPAIQELPVQSAITSVKLGDWTKQAKEQVDVEKQVGSSSEGHEGSRQLSLTGYAYSGGGRAIIRVDVSLDNGKSWSQAHLLPDCSASPVPNASSTSSSCLGHGAWTWRRWRFEGMIPQSTFSEAENQQASKGGETGEKEKRCTTLVVKATDEAYNTQPESHAATWNVRGNLATAWHRVKICSDCSPGAVSKPAKEEK
ncbi:oxidoreductase molybdopterin binding domain-containing protein [Sarocladium implicatum]|nr:oxidoreductase molybdopterin binding domain-containing protein [Sarocladium implicatum]